MEGDQSASAEGTPAAPEGGVVERLRQVLKGEADEETRRRVLEALGDPGSPEYKIAQTLAEGSERWFGWVAADESPTNEGTGEKEGG